MDTKTTVELLSTAIRARTPVIAIESSEETRIIDAIMGLAAEPTTNVQGQVLVESRMVFQWTTTEGIVPLAVKEGLEFGQPDLPASPDPAESLLGYCHWASGSDVKQNAPADDMTALSRALDERASILVMCDVHRFICAGEGGKADVTSIRALRDAFSLLRRSKSVAILIAPHFADLGDAGHDVLKIEWPLPSLNELADMVREAGAKLGDRIPVRLNGDTEVLARTLSGLTWTEAMRTLSMAMVKAGELSVEACADKILDVKAGILKNQRGLEMIQPTDDLSKVGGLELLKAEMAGLPNTLTTAAKAANVKPPRGILLAGPPGTGKTLSAKVAGAAANLPVFIWSVGETHSKYLGESAQYAREVLRAVDAIDNCILVVDEADTQLSAGNDGDNAAYEQVMGMVLTWMQEKTSNVVVILTSNHPEKLRHALMERCDQKWFADYPSQAACEQIIQIHLGKRNLTLSADEVKDLAGIAHSKTLAGRNIEDAIDRANRIAFNGGRRMTAADLADVLARTKGLVQNRPEEAHAIRQWCLNHCEPASRPETTTTAVREVVAGPVDVEL